MVTELELAWLAGIVDGEGCIYGHYINRRNASGGNICVEVRIEATSSAMILKIADICKRADVFFTLDAHRWAAKSTKAAQRINIRRQRDVVKFLRLIREYLVVKGSEAEAAIEWYERWGDQRGLRKLRATDEEKIIFFDRLRSLKRVS